MKKTLEYIWRNKRTGHWASPYSKGSKRYLVSRMRFEKGEAGIAGRIAMQYVWRREDFRPLKAFDFAVEKGTLLIRQLGDKKVYAAVMKAQPKALEVTISGTSKGKIFRTKTLINMAVLGTKEDVRNAILARTIRALKARGLRLGAGRRKSAVYTPSVYRSLKQLRNIHIEFRYVR